MDKNELISARELKEKLAEVGVTPSHDNFWRFLKARGVDSNELVKRGTQKYISRDRLPYILEVAQKPPVRDVVVNIEPVKDYLANNYQKGVHKSIADAIEAARSPIYLNCDGTVKK